MLFFTVIVVLMVSMAQFPLHLDLQRIISLHIVTGDLSLFHDLNGLAVAKTHNLNLTIILHNNDGGGIFEYLPQKGERNILIICSLRHKA